MRNGYFGIALCIAVFAGVVLAFNVVGGIVMAALFGADFRSAGPSALIGINALAQLTVMLSVPILIVTSRRMNFDAVFRLEGIHETPLGAMLVGVPMIILAEVLAGGLDGLWMKLIKLFPVIYDWLASLQKLLDNLMASLTTAHTPGELAILLLGVSLVPAVAEETFFRGFIQTNIERSGNGKSRPYLAIAITSLLFGAMHVSPFNLPGLVLIGAVLGWLAYRTNDLRVSMLAHAMNNGLIVLATFFFQGSHETVEALAGTPEPSIVDSLVLIGVALPLLIGTLYLFQKLTDALAARHNADREIDELTFGRLDG